MGKRLTAEEKKKKYFEDMAKHAEQQRALLLEAKREIWQQQGQGGKSNLAGRPTNEEVRKHANERRAELLRKAEGKMTQKELMQELSIKLLHGNAEKIVQKVLEKALRDDDKDQSAMLKLCIDRIAPASVFDKAKAADPSKGITINITGLGQANVEKEVEGDVLEHDSE